MANTTTTIAREVIAGDWGSGDARVAALKKAGYDPTVIQNEVNRLLCCRELIIQNMPKARYTHFNVACRRHNILLTPHKHDSA